LPLPSGRIFPTTPSTPRAAPESAGVPALQHRRLKARRPRQRSAAGIAKESLATTPSGALFVCRKRCYSSHSRRHRRAAVCRSWRLAGVRSSVQLGAPARAAADRAGGELHHQGRCRARRREPGCISALAAACTRQPRDRQRGADHSGVGDARACGYQDDERLCARAPGRKLWPLSQDKVVEGQGLRPWTPGVKW
jgi:hypothetical protein